MLDRDIYGTVEQLLDQIHELLVQSEQQRRGLKSATRTLEIEVIGMLAPIRLLLQTSKAEFHKKYAKYVDNERLETPEETIERVVRETKAK